VILCCLVRAIAQPGSGDGSVWSNGRIVVSKRKLRKRGEKDLGTATSVKNKCQMYLRGIEPRAPL
jgi:hypothetical protein